MLKLKFLFVTIIFTLGLYGPRPLIAQGNHSNDINSAHYEDAELKDLNGKVDETLIETSQAMDIFDSLSEQDKAELKDAIANGDREKIEHITQKLQKKILTGDMKNMDKVVDASLSQFRKKSPSELRQELKQRLEPTLLGPLIRGFPKLLDITVKLLQDRIALAQLFKITQDKKKLLIFFGINVFLFILKWIVKRRLKKRGASFMSFLNVFFVFFSIRIGVLVVFYHNELYPTFKIIKDVIFR